MEIKGTDSDSSVLGLLMNTQNNDYRFKPTNIGFGYYYVLPIVISGLIAMPESLLIVENPEAHLHPAAQSRLAKFLTQVTLTGVQVIIESHSEHILNALRIGVGNEVFPLTAQDVKVLYFSEAKNATFVEIEIDESGKIADWPVGFFDQTDNDFKILYG